MPRKKTLLILGGTRDAVRLAEAAQARFSYDLSVIYSLAGRTDNRPNLDCEVRVGGFGGTDGLTTYLKEKSVDLVIDATHPFAAQMSRHAQHACGQIGVRILTLQRPMWEKRPGDNWLEAADAPEAAQLAQDLGHNILLTLGAYELPAFAGLRRHITARLLTVPPDAPAEIDLLVGGPKKAAEEQAFMEDNEIDLLVTKASGGALSKGKITAARTLGIPVVMIRRPPHIPGAEVFNTDDALAWIAGALGS